MNKIENFEHAKNLRFSSMNKKGELLSILFIVVVVLILASWAIGEVMKECNEDSDCEEGYYCAGNYQCKERREMDINLNTAAVIIGVSLIIFALIMKWDTIFGKKKKKEEEQPNAEDKGMFEDDDLD